MSMSPAKTEPSGAEVALLGCILIRPEILDEPEISAELRGGFGRDTHRIILDAMLALHSRHVAIDPFTVADELSAEGVLEEVGGTAYLSRLTLDLPNATNFRAYAATLREAARKATLKQLSLDTYHAAQNGTTSDEIVRALHAKLTRLEQGDGAVAWENVEVLIHTPAPAMDWTFSEIIPRGALVGIDAQGGTGKSWFLLELALSAAAGVELLTSFQPVRAMRVMLISAEDPFHEVQRRTQKVIHAFPQLPDLRDRIKGNLRLACGEAMPLIDEAGDATESMRRLRRDVEQFQPDVIILDPRSHFFQGDENSNAHVARFMALLRDLCAMGDGASLFVAHHVSKARQDDMDSAAGRGASAARDGCRVVFSMAPMTAGDADKLGRPDPHNFVRLKQTKQNWSAATGGEILLMRDTGDETGGVLREVSRDEFFREAETGRLEHLARAIADYIGANSEGLTIRDLVNDKPGKDFRLAMKEYSPKYATIAQLRKAFEHGEAAGHIEISSEGTGGRAKKVPRKREVVTR